MLSKLKNHLLKLSGRRRSAASKVPIGEFQGNIFVDHFEVEPYGVFRACGWSLEESLCGSDFLVVQDHKRIAPTILYRTARPDVALLYQSQNRFLGFSVEWIRKLSAEPFQVSIRGATYRLKASHTGILDDLSAPYEHLLLTDQVLHRQHIYGSGPPVDIANRDVLDLALKLPPPILDFGCGSGALIRELRIKGVEAYGIELDREVIRNSLRDDVAKYITLYDGSFPSPFSDQSFESVIASEVIEHIVGYEAALTDIARLTRSTFAITVPDMTCIPIGSQHDVVPWHLLEATHVNFFNYNSLERTLKHYFENVTFFKIGSGLINGSHMPGSLGAIATNKIVYV